jgi:hypothetical protein
VIPVERLSDTTSWISDSSAAMSRPFVELVEDQELGPPHEAARDARLRWPPEATSSPGRAFRQSGLLESPVEALGAPSRPVWVPTRPRRTNSPTVIGSVGFRSQRCGTNPTLRRETRLGASTSVPARGAIDPSTARRNVLFPAPFGPTRNQSSPARISSSIP